MKSTIVYLVNAHAQKCDWARTRMLHAAVADGTIRVLYVAVSAGNAGVLAQDRVARSMPGCAVRTISARPAYRLFKINHALVPKGTTPTGDIA